jgi:hypothetical protein
MAAIEDLIQQRRPGPAVPGRIGRHDVLVEATGFGTSVYQIRGERVLTLRANQLGPGHTDFFARTPLADRGLQVIPVHRSEVVEGEEYESFRPGVIGKNLGIRHHDWTRRPAPRADVRRLDSGAGGLYRHNRRSRRSAKPALVRAESVLKRDLPGLLTGVEVSATDVRGHDLRLRREWDRLRGTLHLAGAAEAVDVDIPRHSALDVFGPLFAGADFDPSALTAAAAGPPEEMLAMRVNDAGRRRYDSEDHPASLDECLRWLRALGPVDGNFLVFAGRSGGIVQMMWQDAPGGPRLWLETPDPSRGRHVTLDEAERMITILARTDRVAVDDLGDLETV